MKNFVFPKTNVVKCVFSYRQNTTRSTESAYNEYDKVRDYRQLKQYYYKVPEYLKSSVAVGSSVIVHCSTGFQLVEVVEVDVLYSKEVEELAPVVAVVDMGSYFMEKDRQKQLLAMKQSIDSEMAKIQKAAMYDLLAEKNPEFAAMLNEYKSLGGTF